MRTWRGLAGSAALIPAPAKAASPLSYLVGFGPKADPVVALTWGMLLIAIGVVIAISLLVLGGAVGRGRHVDIASVPVERGGNGLRWIWIGVGVSSIPLVVALVWTVSVLAAVSAPTGKPAVVIEVTGAQWWWKARYMDRDPARIFTTANEIHIPTGEPVQIRLASADVIHSFWVPALGGKTDTIPGQTNVTWLQADMAGTYRGQCTEFCGWQHAHMGFLVLAQPPAQFQLWEDAQIKPARPPTSPQEAAGKAAFEFHCGACHTVRGSKAGGSVAPDLTHIESRTTLAAVTLPHTIGALSGWIADPQAIKPGVHMPVMDISGPELERIRSYLQTLE